MRDPPNKSSTSTGTPSLLKGSGEGLRICLWMVIVILQSCKQIWSAILTAACKTKSCIQCTQVSVRFVTRSCLRSHFHRSTMATRSDPVQIVLTKACLYGRGACADFLLKSAALIKTNPAEWLTHPGDLTLAGLLRRVRNRNTAGGRGAILSRGCVPARRMRWCVAALPSSLQAPASVPLACASLG